MRPEFDLLQCRSKLTLGDLDVVSSLGTQPVAVGEAEEPAEAKVRVSGDRTLSPDDVPMRGAGAPISLASR